MRNKVGEDNDGPPQKYLLNLEMVVCLKRLTFPTNVLTLQPRRAVFSCNYRLSADASIFGHSIYAFITKSIDFDLIPGYSLVTSSLTMD